MAEIQLFYIGTSKAKEIRSGGSVVYDWGEYGAWTSFKSPVADSSSNVKYNKTTKDAAGASALGGNGGVTVLGSVIPATAQRTIGGETVTVPVRYWKRGYTKYTRTTALKRSNKMLKTIYTTDHPYQYQLQYKDKVTIATSYSKYEDGVDFIFFADHYWNGSTKVNTNGHIPHPVECNISYSDIRKNMDTSEFNNSDGRDNQGSYILSNVRANVVTIELTWTGVNATEGADLLDTLNPRKDSNGQYNYLTVQYLDPATHKPMNKTFFASDRVTSKYPDGHFKEISVTLTEV